MQTPTSIKPYSGAEAIRQGLLAEISRGIRVIDRLDDVTFRSSTHSSSVGEQFRHNLDFLNTFLSGIAIGRIDYTLRERNARVHNSRAYAITRFESAMGELAGLTTVQVGALVSVKSETDPTAWLQSSVVREMEFVFSHTVHHHALIAEKLANKGMTPDATLGVGPSTSSYWIRMAA